MFSTPWHLLLFDRLGVTIIGTLTIIGGKAVDRVSVPSPIVIDILMDTMTSHFVHQYININWRRDRNSVYSNISTGSGFLPVNARLPVNAHLIYLC